MSLAFVDRPPTAAEVERIRLLLSTFQDGTGMLATKEERTLPGWRDFERSVALALSGRASESKDLFDVVLTRPDGPPVPQYGLSCKMRCELNRVDRDGRVTIEVSNSNKKFWDHLGTKELTEGNYHHSPQRVGEALIELVEAWHQAQSVLTRGRIDLLHSFYLILSWNLKGWYQLHQFPLRLIDPSTLHWSFPSKKGSAVSEAGKRLTGDDQTGTLVEWYGKSGGQLKYYPHADKALWSSERFRLEPLPDDTKNVLGKVAAYFPDKWADASRPTEGNAP